jgi:hypothetical protein
VSDFSGHGYAQLLAIDRSQADKVVVVHCEVLALVRQWS